MPRHFLRARDLPPAGRAGTPGPADAVRAGRPGHRLLARLRERPA